MPVTEILESVRQWKLGGKPGNLRAMNHYTENSGYNLFCQKNGKFFTTLKVPLGINLGYTSDASLKKIHFKLPDGVEREVLSGEPVAFGVGGGEEFMRYAHRNVGVNLKWSAKPVFEWRIFGANTQAGKPIPTGALLAIVNVKVEPKPDFFVHVDRPPGMADVGWTTSPMFLNNL
ncbi:MAG TPA: hypothetical protein VF521_12055, partial [Pyrinomonadaceae bacterium]